MYAAWSERAAVMRSLLDAGADPNVCSHRGQTAIMAVSTAFRSLEEKVWMLTAAGGDINAQDADGQTALMIAADGLERSNIVTTLLREGARKDLRDRRGHTVLERLELRARRIFAQQADLRRIGKSSPVMEQMLSTQQAAYEKLRQLLEQ